MGKLDHCLSARVRWGFFVNVKSGIWQCLCISLLLSGLFGCGSDSASTSDASYSRSLSDNGARGLLLDSEGKILLRVDAGNDSIADADTLVQLSSAIATETGVSVAAIQWSQIDGPTALILSPQAQFTYIKVPKLLSETRLSFQIQVTDDQSRVVTDKVSVVVSPLNGFARVTSQSIAETDSDQTIQLEITLTEPQANPVSIAYSTMDGKAKAGLDYVSANGVVDFPAGVTTAVISITILGDSDAEPNEEFYIQLKDAVDPNVNYDRYPVVITDQGEFFDIVAEVTGLAGEIQLTNGIGPLISVTRNGPIALLSDLVLGSPYDFQIYRVTSDQLCTLFNGQGVAGVSSSSVRIECEGATVAISGEVLGLKNPIQVVLNQFNPLSITKNGAFQFPEKLNQGQLYSVSVLTPKGQTCIINNGSGRVGIDPVNNIQIACESANNLVSGNATGISSLVDLQLVVEGQIKETINVNRDGAFAFGTEVVPGQNYEIVLFAPDGLECSLVNDVGVVGENGVDNIQLSCDLLLFDINVDVSGLEGELQISAVGGEPRLISNNGLVTLATLAFGTSYQYEIISAPDFQECLLTNGSGSVGFDGATLLVVCRYPNTVTVGGTAAGISEPIVLTLTTQTVETNLNITKDGSFVFNQNVLPGQGYLVVQSPSDALTCTLGNAEGTVGDTGVNNLQVNCKLNTAPVTATVTGLQGELTLVDGAGNNFTTNTTAPWTLESLPIGADYRYSISSSPPGQECTLSNGTGKVVAAGVVLGIACRNLSYEVGGVVTGLQRPIEVALTKPDTKESETQPLDGVTDYSFSELTQGERYIVTVTSPAVQTCSVSNGEGVIDGRSVSNVDIACRLNPVTVGGTAAGISEPIVLTLTTPTVEANLNITKDGSFVFNQNVLPGQGYLVVQSPSDALTCTLGNAEGTVGDTGVNNLQVNCKLNTAPVTATVTGLQGELTLVDGAGNNFTTNTTAPWTLESLPIGADYRYSISSSPPGQECTLSNGTGKVVAAGVALEISCTDIIYRLRFQQDYPQGDFDYLLTVNGSVKFTTDANNGNLISVLEFKPNDQATISFEHPATQSCTLTQADQPVVDNTVVFDNADITVTITCRPLTYSVSVALMGDLSEVAFNINGGSDSVIVVNNATELLTSELVSTEVYQVSATSLASYEECTYEGNNGAIVNQDVVVSANCGLKKYRVSGEVRGARDASITIFNNDQLLAEITGDVSFTLPATYVHGDSLDLSVVGPETSFCQITPASIDIVDQDISNLLIQCVPFVSVSGTVDGLSSTLELGYGFASTPKSTEGTLSVVARQPFSIANFYVTGDQYFVEILNQPQGQTCTIKNPTGTVTANGVQDISIVCGADASYSVNGSITGTQYPITLQLVWGGEVTVTQEFTDNVFTFDGVGDQATYSVSVLEDRPDRVCAVSNGQGTIDGAAVENVIVKCQTMGRVSLSGPVAEAVISINQGPDFTDADTCSGIKSGGNPDTMDKSGYVNINPSCYKNPGWYLVTSQRGEDIDPDGDGKPNTDSETSGVFHALLSQDQLELGGWQLNVFTEAVYQKARYMLSWQNWDEKRLISRLNTLSSVLLADYLDGLPITYDLLVQFDYLQSASGGLDDTARLRVAKAIRGGSDRLPVIDALFAKPVVGIEEYLVSYISSPTVTAMGYQPKNSGGNPKRGSLFLSRSVDAFSNSRVIDVEDPLNPTIIDLDNSKDRSNYAMNVAGYYFTLSAADSGGVNQINAWVYNSDSGKNFAIDFLPLGMDSPLGISNVVALMDMAPNGNGFVSESSAPGARGNEYLWPVTFNPKSDIYLFDDPTIDQPEALSLQLAGARQNQGPKVIPLEPKGNRLATLKSLQGRKYPMAWSVYNDGFLRIHVFDSAGLNQELDIDLSLAPIKPVELVTRTQQILYQAMGKGTVNGFDIGGWVCCTDLPRTVASISDNASAPVVGMNMGQQASNVEFGSFLYIARTNGIYVYQVIDPVNPVLRHIIDVDNKFKYLEADDGFIYAADDNGVYIFNAPVQTVPFHRNGAP